MPLGAPSSCLTLPGHRPPGWTPLLHRPHGQLRGAAPAPVPEPWWSREEEEEERGAEGQRGVGWGGGVSGEGREQERGTAGRRQELVREWRKETPGEERAQGQGEGDGGEGGRGRPGTW